MNKHMQTGFTLIELMITLAIASILISMAVPSFTHSIQNNKVLAETNMLLSAIAYARSEAIKRGNKVTICASKSFSATTPCDSNDWSDGWVIYSAVDSSQSRNNTILKVQQDPMSNTIKATVDSLTFDSLGMTIAASDITVCDSTKTVDAMSASVSMTGRAQSSKTEAVSCS